MYEQEKIKPYDGEGEKGKLIEEMFDNIAPTYDTLIIVFLEILIRGGVRKLFVSCSLSVQSRCLTLLQVLATLPFLQPKS